MFELLYDIPAYSPITFSKLTGEEYVSLVEKFRKELNRADELFKAYWKTGNVTLFDMSLEALRKAQFYMVVLSKEVTNEAILGKLRNRATFAYDLAAAMMGATNG